MGAWLKPWRQFIVLKDFVVCAVDLCLHCAGMHHSLDFTSCSIHRQNRSCHMVRAKFSFRRCFYFMLFDAWKVFILFLSTHSLSFFVSFKSFPLFLLLSITWMKPQATHLLSRLVEAVMLLTYISEVSYSNLGTLVVLTEGFKSFPESFQVNAVVVP